MSSPGSSPRKRLKLTRKTKKENEEENGPNKRAKIDPAEAKLEALKKENFMKACLQVSYEAYIDFKKRFQLIYFPACIDNKCIHHDKNAKIEQVTQSSEKYFNIEVKNKTWFEAIEVCLMCITSSQYLSSSMLMDIVEIIMNAHEDDNSGYSIEYVLRQCQHTLLYNFRMHPPCITKGIRDCYKQFLMSPLIKKENNLSNRACYDSQEGIVSYCISRLLYELSMESKDGTLLDKQEVPEDIQEEIQKIYWKKHTFELFEFLVRTERIERLMMVLECLIHLLQTDLALWHSRRFSTNGQTRSQRPLLAYVLWPINCLTDGAVTQQCHKIIELYAYFIHLSYG
ncbi:uncharacterized protein [Epargyreus clarus]|uniref:uncharacterized protein n=1 Tax=Epargyreus clarus TaxID=520877 RepID=UPI003C2C682B